MSPWSEQVPWMGPENQQGGTARQHGAGYVCVRHEGLQPLVQLIYSIYHRPEEVTKSWNHALNALKAVMTNFQDVFGRGLVVKSVCMKLSVTQKLLHAAKQGCVEAAR